MFTREKPPVYVRSELLRGAKVKSWSLIMIPVAFAIGCFWSCIFVVLAFVIPLWPVTLPLFLCLAVAAPFVCPLMACGQLHGRCPVCSKAFSVWTRHGGFQCRGCRRGLRIVDGRVFQV